MATPSHNDGSRRAFFRDAASRVVRPLANYLEKHIPIGETSAVLRPPGAIAESQFSDTCQRCGECVKVCPADAIFPLDGLHGDKAGTPVIDPDLAACVVCVGLQCTTVCPSGALLPLLNPSDIRMGLAEVYEPICVRTDGEECTICVDRCPLGTQAIRFDDAGAPSVLSPGCVGCGVCQLYCPTDPKAIVIKPI